MSILLYVMAGGAVGAGTRYLVSTWALHTWHTSFPWGTLICNVLGSFLIGVIAVQMGPEGRLHAFTGSRHFFMTGMLGGFTTFSTFSLQTMDLAKHGQMGLAALNAGVSLVLCLVGVVLGAGLGGLLNAR